MIEGKYQNVLFILFSGFVWFYNMSCVVTLVFKLVLNAINVGAT